MDESLQSGGATSANLLKKFRSFATGMVGQALNFVGWDKKEGSQEGHLDTKLRSLLVSLLADVADLSDDSYHLFKEASSRFNALLEMEDSSAPCPSLPSDIKQPVFKVMLRGGGAKEYEEVQRLLASCDSIAERKIIYSSLGHTKVRALKQQVLRCGWHSCVLHRSLFMKGEITISERLYQHTTLRI